MCEYCDHDEQMYCQECGRSLCYDTNGFDDVFSAPYVTMSGDLFCIPCGSRVDEADEEADDEDNYFYDQYSEWEDIVEGEEGGRYIGPGSEVQP
jgi:hypothetical protein